MQRSERVCRTAAAKISIKDDEKLKIHMVSILILASVRFRVPGSVPPPSLDITKYVWLAGSTAHAQLATSY